MKRLYRWAGVLVLVLIAAAPFGLRYLDRLAADAATRNGMALVNQKQYPEAIEAFNHAIKIDPEHAPAYHGRGVAYLNQGNLDQALIDLNEAIRLDPNDARALYHRGVVYFRTKNFDQSLADFTEVIRLRPDSANAYLAGSSSRQKGR